MFTEDDITKYQKLYRARFGKDIDRLSACEQLSTLIQQMKIIYQPITSEQVSEFVAKDKLNAAARTKSKRRNSKAQ